MRAVVFEGVGRVAVREVSDPRIEDPGDAVVRVAVSAICGSDLHFLHGKAPIAAGETIGHEAVGVVDSVGPGVAKFAPGDRVVVAFSIACGDCWFCSRGETQLCDSFRTLGAGAFGGSLGGAQAEWVRVPFADTNLLAIPDGVGDEGALFVGDVLTTGSYAAAYSRFGPADTVAVIGCGPVGYSTVLALLAGGAREVFAIDREADRLALAAEAGARCVDARERDPQMAISERTGDRGADVVIEAVGRASAFELSLDVVRRGGTVVIAGMYAGETIAMQLGVVWARALRLAFTGVCPVHAGWERVMREVAAGRLDPTPLVSHRLALAEAPHGYELFDSKAATKVLLRP